MEKERRNLQEHKQGNLSVASYNLQVSAWMVITRLVDLLGMTPIP